MSMDLNSLSFKELKDLQSQVVRAIATFEDRAKRAVASELEELAKARGFSLSDLVSLAGPRKRAASGAKYANPADASQTWSGRGRKPRWFTAAIAAGKKPEDLAI
jgi:DNA-binding protein H-NS